MCCLRRILCLIFVLVYVVSISGCEIDVEYDDELYSRADFANMEKSVNYGYGRNDDIYVALSYFYNLDSISRDHGTDFILTANDIVCHFSEGSSFFFMGLFNGSAQYSISIDRCTYILTLYKPWIGQWRVEECYLAELP